VLANGAARQFQNVALVPAGSGSVDIGWVLDPLSSVMLVMVSLIGLLIFIYSLGYMAGDGNYARFFASCRCLRQRCWGW